MALHVLFAAGFDVSCWGNVCCYWHKFSQGFVEQNVATRSFTKAFDCERSFSNIRALNAEFASNTVGFVWVCILPRCTFLSFMHYFYMKRCFDKISEDQCMLSATQTPGLKPQLLPLHQFECVGVYQNAPFALWLWHFLLKHKISFSFVIRYKLIFYNKFGIRILWFRHSVIGIVTTVMAGPPRWSCRIYLFYKHLSLGMGSMQYHTCVIPGAP